MSYPAPTKLNHVLSVERDVKATGLRRLTDCYHKIQKLDLLKGISRTYKSRDDVDGDTLPSEEQRVQVTVPSMIKEAMMALTDLCNTVALKDYTNQFAKADVMLDGKIFIKGAPATYLLWLEKQLVDIATFVKSLPTLDTAEQWTRDEQQTHVFKTAASTTHRTKKVESALIIVPATDKHPAQAKTVIEDIIEGFWTTVKYSGAVPQSQIDETLERIQTLQQAVKFARVEANSTAIVKPEVQPGDVIFHYIFG